MIFSSIRRALRIKTPLELASAELVEAQRSLLECETAREYSDSLAQYNRTRILRLKVRIKDLSSEGGEA